MRIYKYSEARRQFSSILNEALKEEVIITRKDGSTFKIIPLHNPRSTSPFDIDGIDTGIKTDEILECIKDSRRSE